MIFALILEVIICQQMHNGKSYFRIWLVEKLELGVFVREWGWGLVVSLETHTESSWQRALYARIECEHLRAWVVKEDALISSLRLYKSLDLGGLNNKHLFPTVHRAEVKIRVPAQLEALCESPLLVLASHGLFSFWYALGAEREWKKEREKRERKRESERSSLFFFL